MHSPSTSAEVAVDEAGRARLQEPPPPTKQNAVQPRWSLARRIGFRLVFTYFVLNLFPPPLPGLDVLNAVWMRLCTRVTLWVALHVLHISYHFETEDNGSSDSTSYWVLLFWTVALAVIVTVVWSVIDRRRARYDFLCELLRIELRYVLATVMVGFGLVKLIELQMPPLTPMRLLQRVGDLSPMALMWTFMGYSRAYVHFAGIAELVGGALVLFRRTTALGAIVVLTVMTNVVLLNFCYDVPVKILSVHVWLMALILLAPDLGRLADLLVLNRPTSSRSLLLRLPRRWMRIARMILKPAFIAAMVLSSAISMLQFKRSFLGGTPPSFEGVWDVEAQVRTGETLPPLLLQVARWRRVGFSHGRMTVDPMDDRLSVPLAAAFDESARTITLTDEPRERCTLRYTRVDDGHVTLESGAGSALIQLRLRKHDAEPMLLLTRGFHWISEESYNR